MLLLFSLIIFSLLSLKYSTAIESWEAAIQFSETHTFVEIIIHQPVDHLEIIRADFPLFSIEVQSSFLEMRPVSSKMQPKQRENSHFCHFLSWKLPVIRVSTSFSSLLPNQNPQMSLKSGNQSISFEIKLANGSFVPREMCNHLKVATIEEGKKLYKHFSRSHFERNLSFHQFIPAKSDERVSIVTLPRSGTHLLERNIEEVFGEYASSFPKFKFNPKKGFGDLISSGHLKGLSQDHSKFAFHHDILPKIKGTSRIVYHLRNPLPSIESLFHYRAAFDRDSCKIKGEFISTQFFRKFVEYKSKETLRLVNMAKKFGQGENQAVLYTRYEDLVLSPLETLCRVAELITIVPCWMSYKGKIDELLKGERLGSYYKKKREFGEIGQKDSLKDEEVHPRERETSFKELMGGFGWEKYPETLLEITKNNTEAILKEFGYECFYEKSDGDVLECLGKSKGKLLPFQESNMETMGKLLSYQKGNIDKTKILQFQNLPFFKSGMSPDEENKRISGEFPNVKCSLFEGR